MVMNEKYYVGIDLGKKGGIVVIRGNKLIHKEVMPFIGDEEIDVNRVAGILQKYHKSEFGAYLVLERFGGFFGYNKSAAVSLGSQGGEIVATAKLVGIPYIRVMPTVWTKTMWAGIKTYTKKGGKKDTKKMSLLALTKIFPKEKWLATSRSKVAHDGMVDSALLAIYGQRKGF